jgi:hypothetical protein
MLDLSICQALARRRMMSRISISTICPISFLGLADWSYHTARYTKTSEKSLENARSVQVRLEFKICTIPFLVIMGPKTVRHSQPCWQHRTPYPDLLERSGSYDSPVEFMNSLTCFRSNKKSNIQSLMAHPASPTTSLHTVASDCQTRPPSSR